MADYIYLLQNRLSAAQRAALHSVREIARAKGLTVFLVGGAVRDLTSGSPVRDLDVVIQGSALKLKKELEKAGGVLTGELEGLQAMFFLFPGSVRLEVGSTVSVTFPKPGKAVVKPATILEDLRRRDFTANAMALSLNEGSYGLLMDPLNGVADIENRELRLVSNYGFIEDPVRMIRGARLMARLGWAMDEKTQARYETGQREGYISALSEYLRGYETEEIVHEEDPLRVLKRLETEGWMKVLAPYWTSAKANAVELERLRDVQAQLQMQGIQPDLAAASFPLLAAKLTPKETATLKAGFARQGFVKEIDALDGEAKEFAAQLTSKAAAEASQSWRMLMAAKPEAVLWMTYSTKNAPLQAKLKSFMTEWPQARQKMPYQLMQEMRITPEVVGYEDLLERLFFELMDGHLSTPEEMKVFLEPYSPPAPPPPVNLRRPRAQKKDAKGTKSRAKKIAVEEEAGPAVNVAVEETEPLPEVEAEDEAAAPKPAPQAAAAKSAKMRPQIAPSKAPAAKAAAAKQPALAKTAPAKDASSKASPIKGVANAALSKSASTATGRPKTSSAKVQGSSATAKKAAAPQVKKAAAPPAKKLVPVPAKKAAAKTGNRSMRSTTAKKVAAPVGRGGPAKPSAAKTVAGKTQPRAGKVTVKAAAKTGAVKRPVKGSSAAAKVSAKKVAVKTGRRK